MLSQKAAGTRQSVFESEIATPSKTGLAMTKRGQVIVSIQDNGPGIPADKLKDVFRPFYTTKAEGTGLGLYITQQLVEKIGGRIHVESALNKGTAFVVNLPVQGVKTVS